MLRENAKAADAYAHADALEPVDARLLADWAEAHVRGLAPGAAPSPEAVAVLQRLEKAEPRNALALFYLGAASFAAGDKAAAASAGRRCWRCCPPMRRSASCWSSASGKPKAKRRPRGPLLGQAGQHEMVAEQPAFFGIPQGMGLGESGR